MHKCTRVQGTRVVSLFRLQKTSFMFKDALLVEHVCVRFVMAVVFQELKQDDQQRKGCLL